MQLESHITKLDKPLQPAVVGYLVRDNQVLLGLRKKVSFGLGDNLIAGIGGKIELDQAAFEQGKIISTETAEQALVREFQEEIGVTPTEFERLGRIRFVFPGKPKWNQEVIAYRCTKWTGNPIETEAISPQWFDINQLEQVYPKMWPDNQYWIKKIMNGHPVNAIFIYGDDNASIVKREIEL